MASVAQRITQYNQEVVQPRFGLINLKLFTVTQSEDEHGALPGKEENLHASTVGMAVEAARSALDYAFDTLGVERVWAQVRDTTIAFVNVAIRLRMTVRGRFVKHNHDIDMPDLAFALDRPATGRGHSIP